MATATGKVRIFELAKELGMSSKDLIVLFERLGLEAKNQLNVVDPKVADLLRLQLGKSAAAAKAAPKAPATKRVAAPATTVAPPVEPAAPVDDVPAAAAPVAAPKVRPAAKAAPVIEAVSTLKPVTGPVRRAVAVAAAPPLGEAVPAVSIAPAAAALTAPVLAETAIAAGPVAVEPPALTVPFAGTVVAEPTTEEAPKPAVRRTPPPKAPDVPMVTLRPVPAGQASIIKPRVVVQPEAPPAGPNSATPGPQTGIPGRPGVAPRPGQGLPGQGYQQRPLTPPNANGVPGVPMASRPTRPASNGPFRPLSPPGPRPFTPRPPGAVGNGPTTPGQGPSPSSGPGGRGPGGPRGHHRDDQSKKDREKDMLLDKARNRKRYDSAPAAPTIQLETIEIPDLLTVQELATSLIIVPAKDIIKELMKMGTFATINQSIPSDVAISVAKKFGFNAIVKEAGDEVIVEQEEDKPELLTTRPPVVTVLGHVDHGKTSLLDKIRVANVASGEAGGITQRIGAYTVDRDNRKITFIDTPGHEAFTAMRARGAKVTDVAILVVAADDGVMPQTREAISHIKAAGVPIVVAINKMDKPDASPERVMQQLTEEGLQPVAWGGKIEMVPVSARTGDGIEKLLETVLLEADLRELKANTMRRASGVVIESALDKGRGAVATVLIQNGTLRVGDVVVVGGAFGKIRALMDDKGKQVKKAGPSIPVEIMGLSDVPAAGDTLMVVSDERVAREAASKRSVKRRDTRMASTSGPRVSLESFMAMPASGGSKTLNLIIKADGQGAVEALRSRVESLSNQEVDIRVILAGVGAITPNDVNLAAASNAVLIGFNIRPDETVKRVSENEQVDLRFYQVIYDVENDLKKAMVGMLAPKYREIVLGRAEVREIFKVSKIGTIAGCYVQSGKLTRNAKVRVVRDSAVAFEGELESLRRFKDDVKEVAENYECGVQVARFADLKVGDVIEAFMSELVAPELQPA